MPFKKGAPADAKTGNGNGITRGTRRGNGGWGGPAKGADPNRKAMAPPMEPGNKVAVGRANPTDKAQALKDHLYKLATEAAREETQVRAAEAWLNREEGMPVSRNLNFNVDDLSALDDDALAQRREALERELREATGGATAPSDPSQPDGMVH